MRFTDYEEYFIKRLVRRIDFLRSEQGLSLYQLAKKSCLSENTIKSIYKKKSSPNLLTLNKICEALGVSLSEFFLYEGGVVDFTWTQLELLKNYQKLCDESRCILFELTKFLK